MIITNLSSLVDIYYPPPLSSTLKTDEQMRRISLEKEQNNGRLRIPTENLIWNQNFDGVSIATRMTA
jgi:hypothetical protein